MFYSGISGIDTQKTAIHSSLGQELEEPTITMLVGVKNHIGQERRSLQVKMRCGMPFGELVALLKRKFDTSQNFGLQMKAFKDGESSGGVRLIFDSDTPASVRLSSVA